MAIGRCAGCSSSDDTLAKKNQSEIHKVPGMRVQNLTNKGDPKDTKNGVYRCTICCTLNTLPR